MNVWRSKRWGNWNEHCSSEQKVKWKKWFLNNFPNKCIHLVICMCKQSVNETEFNRYIIHSPKNCIIIQHLTLMHNILGSCPKSVFVWPLFFHFRWKFKRTRETSTSMSTERTFSLCILHACRHAVMLLCTVVWLKNEKGLSIVVKIPCRLFLWKQWIAKLFCKNFGIVNLRYKDEHKIEHCA